MSYKNAIKHVDTVRISKKLEKFTDADQMKARIDRLPRRIHTNKKTETTLTYSETVFLDYFSEEIYNLYRDLRECYRFSGLFNTVDYNGFLDIYLNNIKLSENEIDEDEESHETDDF